MRLLKLGPNGELERTKDLTHDIPPYAILSHTWGCEEDEVTFQDIINLRWRGKCGSQKVLFCGEQARRDRIDHFWVDTCCIDKRNSTELTEAINSMFLWYQAAKKCYVYMADVSYANGRSADTQSKRMLEFQKSRWFTRGWTLQELLAPRDVEFFSSEGFYFGNKQGLAGTISTVTGIPMPALNGSSLSEFSIKERISWSRKRRTTRPEDQAYSLMGILELHMPLIYGEGGDQAMRRLETKAANRDGIHHFRDDRSTYTILLIAIMIYGMIVIGWNW